MAPGAPADSQWRREAEGQTAQIGARGQFRLQSGKDSEARFLLEYALFAA